MEKKNIRQIFKDFLLGQTGEKTEKAIDDWYQSFDNEKIADLSAEDAQATREEIWERIGLEMGESPTGRPTYAAPMTVEPAGPKPGEGLIHRINLIRRMRPMTRIAATVILLAGAAGTFILVRHRTDCCQEASFSTISTGIGEKKILTTPDGSKLTLDAATTLRIQDDFSQHRYVELVDGQAFFEVAPDRDHPFTVKAGGLVATVLGTSFGIANYQDVPAVRIGVVSGKISVVDEGKDGHAGNGQGHMLQTLEASQEIVYDKRSQHFEVIPLDELLTAWQEGRFVMNDLSFEEMAAICQKHYGVQIVAGDEAIRHTRYTTELLNTATPQQVIEILAAIHDCKIRQEGPKTIFSSKTNR